jgi:hypothetical protein
MNDGWKEGAAGVKFGNIAQSEFESEIDDAAAQDNKVADLEAQLVIEKDIRDDKYRALDAKSNLVANGVRGDANYGPDSPLYGAMGFIRKSERASGLTRKK